MPDPVIELYCPILDHVLTLQRFASDVNHFVKLIRPSLATTDSVNITNWPVLSSLRGTGRWVWQFDVILDMLEYDWFSQMLQKQDEALQNNYVSMTLIDKFHLIRDTDWDKHSRVVVAGSQKIIDGMNFGFIATRVFIKFSEDGIDNYGLENRLRFLAIELP